MHQLLKPSEIRFSQDSISNTFDIRCLHSDTHIGETLDMICEGRCSIRDIPKIKVGLHNGNYISLDNRRLWVFQQLEKLGRCSHVPVMLVNRIPAAKLTSENDGLQVRVRGPPGGVWYRKASRGTTQYVAPEQITYDLYSEDYRGRSSRPTVSSYSASRGSTIYSSASGSRSSSYESFGYPSVSNSRVSPSQWPHSSRVYSGHDTETPKKDDGWWCTIL